MDWTTDEFFMREALKQAELAYQQEEVPVGAVVVANDRIISRAHNLTERLTDATAHAEMQALTAASHALSSKYLPDCTLFVTLEPCVMCSGALFWSQIGRVVFGAYDEKRGFHSWKSLALHPKTEWTGGLLEQESSELLQSFFRARRK
jgi:tRNA(adenine34) deaminase